jgi:hypothetical protein
MKKAFLLVLSVFLLSHTVATAESVSLDNSSSFKMTMIRNGVEYEWEYNNPNEYEYEYANSVIKNEKAKETVVEMFELLDVSPDAKVKNMVSALKEFGYHDIDRLDIRWTNSDEKLYTWVWNTKSD